MKAHSGQLAIVELMKLNLPDLSEVLDESEFFERERTDRKVVELAILLYNHDVSLRKVARVLGWLGVERSHVAIWKWIQTFGQRLTEAGRRPAADLPAIVLMDESAVSQRGEEFTLFAAVDPETRHLLHASVAPSRNTLTTRRFLSELAKLYERAPPIVVTDGASYGPVFTPLGTTHIVRRHSVRKPRRTLDPRTETPDRQLLRLVHRKRRFDDEQLA